MYTNQRFDRGRFNQGRVRSGFRPRGRRIKTIDPRFFVQRAVELTVEEYQASNQFTDFDLDSRLMQNIVDRGYKTPTPIQDKTIPALLEGRDVIGVAGTGTGKTAAFLIPLINKIIQDPSQKVLIITPTRELAMQIDDEFRLFARGLFQYSAVCIGGAGIGFQISQLRKHPQFVIGTPGRLQDLERQRKIFFGDYTNIVLDEVDRMLDMGFVREITYIISKLPPVRQSLFFSATLPASTQRVMQEFLHNPLKVEVEGIRPSANVDQDVIRLAGREKVNVLHDLLKQEEFKKVLVFGRTKWGIERLARELIQRGIRVLAIHGNKNQGQRRRALDQFKANQAQALLATDVASRGLDIDDVTHVINFDQPESYEDYIHRIGRTGRANKKGKALTFID